MGDECKAFPLSTADEDLIHALLDERIYNLLFD